MSFSIKKQGDVVVVDVEGQLIVGNRQELKQKVLDELEKDEGIQSIAHRGSEWIMERHHSMFLRERMGPELKVHL